MSVGAGWQKFIRDQDIGYGVFLTFEVVDELRLVVGIHRGTSLAQADSPQEDVAPNYIVNDYGESPEGMKNIPCLPSWLGINEVLGDARRPQFQKTLRKSHTKQCASSKLVSLSPKIPSPNSIVCDI